MNVCMSVFVGLIAVTTQAMTNVWDGGSTTDNNWSSAENWAPDGVPTSASDTWLQFTGNTRLTPQQNIATPFVLNRLDFLGGATYTTAITIGGGPLQFVTNGVISPCISLDRNASCSITNAIDIPAGTTLITDIGTYGVDLRGAITGSGAIDKTTRSGGLSLYNSANTFSGGLTIRASNNDWTKFNVYASNAMGTGPVNLYSGTMATNKTSPGGLAFYGTTTHTNTIALYDHSPIFIGMPNNTATVTLNGNIDLNTYTLHLRGGGIGTINGVISEGGASALVKSDAGTWTLNAANTFTGKIALINGTLKLGTNGVLDSSVAVSFSCVTSFASTAYATLDLGDRTQRIRKLEGYTAQPWLTNIVTSATNATLVIHQDETTVFNGCFTGALRLIKDGTGSLTLTNYPSTFTGDLIISNGTLVVAAGASLANNTNIIVSGGTLDLQAAAALADTARLYITTNTSVINLGSGTAETIHALYINGVSQPSGTYGATGSSATHIDDIHFTGSNVLYVARSMPIWDAGGSDANMSTGLNWAGDTAPVFDGTVMTIFATSGTTAVVDIPMSLYGMTFNRGSNFTLAAGAGIISNGVGGIEAFTPSSSCTYTIAEDMILTGNQTWSVSTNTTTGGRATLDITGVIDDQNQSFEVSKTDFGTLYLRGANTFSGQLTIQAGDLNIYHSHALGTTNGVTVINGGLGARLGLYGNLVIEEPLILNGERNNNGTLFVGSGSNVLAGALICSNQVRFQVSNGPLVISGGVTSDNNGLFVINSGIGNVTAFKDKPLNLGARTFWSDSDGLTLLSVSGNTWADMLVANGTVRCTVPNALPPSSSLRIGVWYSPGGTLDINGCDQTISRFYMDNPLKVATRTVTSSVPAQLTVNQNSDTIIDPRFTGAVSLLKLGSGTLSISNAFTTTTGSFIVSNGTLAVINQGTFGPNSKNIVVAGTGRLVLSNSLAIADTATVSMPANGVNTAKIDLADGVTETVGFLYFGALSKYATTYGSSESTAAIKDDDHFTGKGVLRVMLDRTGTRMIIH